MSTLATKSPSIGRFFSLISLAHNHLIY